MWIKINTAVPQTLIIQTVRMIVLLEYFYNY